MQEACCTSATQTEKAASVYWNLSGTSRFNRSLGQSGYTGEQQSFRPRFYWRTILTSSSSHRGLRWGALLLLLLSGLPVYARVRHGDAWAREHFTAAERMREALNGRPPAQRARHDYQRVINAYRNVYYGAPNSSKADSSVVAVAEMLVEMGRQFDDDKLLKSAVGQYRFLRREYPGSKYRFDA